MQLHERTKEILNKNGNKYSEEEVKAIHGFLTNFAKAIIEEILIPETNAKNSDHLPAGIHR